MYVTPFSLIFGEALGGLIRATGNQEQETGMGIWAETAWDSWFIFTNTEILFTSRTAERIWRRVQSTTINSTVGAQMNL